jgi:integrase
MAVRAHGNGWQIRFQHRGHHIARTVRGTKTEAQQIERALRAKLERGGAAPTLRRTLDDALTRWLTGEARALRSHADAVDKARHWLPWATRPITEAPAVVAEAVRTWLTAGLAPATINRRIAALRRALNLDYRDGIIAEPIGGRIKSLAGERPRYTQATPEQIDALIKACRHPRVREAIHLAVLTGLRQGELLALDPERHLQRDAKTNNPAAILLDATTKTGRPRMIPLNTDAARIAATLPFGLTYAELRTAFEAARTAANLPWLQWRDLRRTFGSWVVQTTGNLKAAQDLLGHTTPAITARHYAHLLPSHLVDAVARLPEVRPAQTGQELAKLASKKARNTRKKVA